MDIATTMTLEQPIGKGKCPVSLTIAPQIVTDN